ncbi:hypothetical protein KPH14_012683 [Odynerus spinipes]|uniref:Uncharacterized protein n=1 Tax=Odynerus spinipes TaxID=1348599 RepID=A0AAD9R8T0_9HYME|nr:hypothetical protein KPH14_012683 [Odynerus spinipes]
MASHTEYLDYDDYDYELNYDMETDRDYNYGNYYDDCYDNGLYDYDDSYYDKEVESKNDENKFFLKDYENERKENIYEIDTSNNKCTEVNCDDIKSSESSELFENTKDDKVKEISKNKENERICRKNNRTVRFEDLEVIRIREVKINLTQEGYVLTVKISSEDLRTISTFMIDSGSGPNLIKERVIAVDVQNHDFRDILIHLTGH